jgi:zinc transport system substrate-binding protein
VERKTLLIAIALLIVIFLVSTVSPSIYVQKEKQPSREKIGVVVSIPPLAEFVEKIGGERVFVLVMVPPGANPHTYEPTSIQLKEVSKAKLYVKAGSGVEFELVWLDKILEFNKDILVVDCSQDVELVGGDPHIWLSPRNAKIMVANIYEGLVQVDPQGEAYYAKNKEEYVRKLTKLDREIAESLSEFQNRKFMVYHPAWGYFARDYNLTQIPIEKEGKEPTARDLSELVKQAKADNIKIIFASPEFNPKTGKVIADEIGCKVVFISPLAKDYMANLRKVTAELVQALN